MFRDSLVDQVLHVELSTPNFWAEQADMPVMEELF